jgi:drug/metabolite transporter (DMT)-like permease
MAAKKGVVADLLLVLICLFWGMSFILVKNAIMELDLYWFLFLRFTIATAILLAVFARRLKRFTRHSFRDGFILGSVLFSAFVLQTIGLKYTSASNAGFITGLHVILVPFILALFFRKLPAATATIGAVICAAGLFLLTVSDDFTINRGDVWVIACAVSVAFHVILTGWYAVKHDVYLVAIAQMVAMTFWAGASAVTVGTAPDSLSAYVIGAILFLAVFSTAFNFTVQTWAQQYTSPTRAAVIFTMEPVFAVIFAFWWGGEVLKSRGYLGAGLILVGIILAEFRTKQWREEQGDGTAKPVGKPGRETESAE